MQEIILTLERRVQEVQFGSVSVELKVHNGIVVKTIFTTAQTLITRNSSFKDSMEATDE